MTGNDDRAKLEGTRVTWAGVGVNAFLMVVKFAGGIVGHSQALIADAVHTVSDFFTDAVVLIGLRAGRKEPDADHPFGHGRVETMASAVVGLALISVGGMLAIGAGLNIHRGDMSHPAWPALVAAALSVAMKEVLYRYTAKIGRRIKSPVLVANAWHHRSDALSSVAVLVGVGGALINPRWCILDSFAALVVSIFVLKAGFSVLWDAVKEVTDTAPDVEVLEEMHRLVEAVPGVEEAHDLKVRLSGGLYQVQVHVVVDADLTVTEGHRIAKEAEAVLRSEVEDVADVIVHVDPRGE